MYVGASGGKYNYASIHMLLGKETPGRLSKSRVATYLFLVDIFLRMQSLRSTARVSWPLVSIGCGNPDRAVRIPTPTGIANYWNWYTFKKNEM